MPTRTPPTRTTARWSAFTWTCIAFVFALTGAQRLGIDPALARWVLVPAAILCWALVDLAIRRGARIRGGPRPQDQ